MLLTSNFALVVFLVIVVAAIIIAFIYRDFANYDRTAVHTFVSIIGSLSIFILIIFYYNLIQAEEGRVALAGIQELARVQEEQNNLLSSSLIESSKIIPNFVNSITPLTTTICCTGANSINFGTGANNCSLIIPEDNYNIITCTQKTTLSGIIFAIWADVILSNKFIKQFNQLGFVSNFLQYANSQQLYQQWTVMRLNYSPKSQQFGDLLFEYGLPITTQTAENYTNIAQQLINDPRYQDIISQ